ncbi:MAG: gluconolactonase [Frankiaceae bacterium]|jgi:gluconolactonase|nr:gluconolactonase [Frankiaceae bacterium]
MTPRIAPGLRDLVGAAPAVEPLASGFRFTEGPVWHPVRGDLVFSDIPADERWRWTPERGAERIAHPTRKGNGMTYDAELRLLVCEHSSSCVVRFDGEGRREVLASSYEGLELNSPNDVIVAPDGSVLFTDPTFGRNDEFGIQRAVRHELRGVYRLPPGGGLQLLADDFEEPNGLCLSPDGSRLYVNDSPGAQIRCLDRDTDGSVSNGVLFADGIGTGVFGEGIVDGMKCDALGNVWVTGPGGVWVFDPDGGHLGVVDVPEEVGNLHWGGPDWSHLYICASHGLYRLRTGVTGSREPFMGPA